MPWRRVGQRYPRLRSFLSRRLDSDEALGLNFTLSLLLAFLALSLFALLAYSVYSAVSLNEPNELTGYDARLSSELKAHAARTPTLKALFLFITDLGDTITLATLSTVVVLVLLIVMLRTRRHYLLGAFWIIATVGEGLLNLFLKDVCQRPRPTGGELHPGGWSFPSGHSMGSFVVYGMLAYLLMLAVRRWWVRAAIVGGLSLLVLAIGFSRAYLGAHWPSDVVGGFAAGAVWLALCITAAEALRRRGPAGDPGASRPAVPAD